MDLCAHLCNPFHCFTDIPDEDPCMTFKQTFVCGYDDAVVCSDEFGTCIHESSKSLCACKIPSGWSRKLDSSCKDDSLAPGLGVASLTAACILAVILLILVVTVSCCLWKRGLPCSRSNKRSARRESEEMVSKGINADEQAPDQPVPDQAEYSYAYGHRSWAPADHPRVGIKPDLDELQDDHYYSRLKLTDSTKSTPGQENAQSSTCPVSGKEDHLKYSGDGGTYEGPANGGVKAGYVNAQSEEGAQNQSSGYEVAQVQRPSDFALGQSNLISPSTDERMNRDSGYEIATVKPVLGAGDKHHSYVTLEPPTEILSQSKVSGYEEVTQVWVILEELSDYDHLQRPGSHIQIDGTN
ncbi:uncharacterized protein LOC110989907 isoform X2 [Acanthaster planci]|nr:uncharacterized protein LOC110989907 isoform X2 [Acanthaster planci]